MGRWSWIRRLVSPERTARGEVEEELRFHIEGRIRELVEEGRDEEEARTEVLRCFGDYATVEEACRRFTRERMERERRRMRMGDVTQDLGLAVRTLRRRPGFTITAVVTLALAMGAGAAVFSVVDGVLLRPLPYRDSDRLVRVFEQNSPTNRWALSVVDFLAIRERARTLESVAAVSPRRMAMTAGQGPQWVLAGVSSAGLLGTMGISPSVGRDFRPNEERPGSPPVVIVSHAFAQRVFGKGADPLGRTLTLDGEPHEVVGVLPPGVRELAGLRLDVWPLLQIGEPSRRGPFGLRVIGRLADGASVSAAADDLARVSREIFPRWADNFQDETATLTPYPLQQVMVGDVRRILLLLLAAVGLVLLIALTNVANLVLSRALDREGELSIRVALGASRGRLGRMLVAETLVLTTLGGALGLLVAVGGVRLLRAMATGVPRLYQVGVDGRVVAAQAAVILVSGALLGLAPVLQPGGPWSRRPLQGHGRRAFGDRRMMRLRGLLVAGEFALALPVAAAAGLMLNTLVKLQSVDPGVDPEGVFAVRVVLPAARYESATDRLAFWDQAVQKVAAIPGVSHAALAQGLPPDAPAYINNFDLVDRPVAPGSPQPVAPWSAVTDEFFRALGIELEEGRLFRASDGPAGPPVALVTRSWVQRYHPGDSPVGRAMVEGGCYQCTPTTIVGVVGDVKFMGMEGGGEGVFVPYRQWVPPAGFLLVDSELEMGAVLGQIREALRSLDAELPLDDVSTLDDRLRASVSGPRNWATLLGVFAGAGGLLAAVGVFGVLSYMVNRQRREIGVRMALGADRGRVVRLIVGRGMLRVIVGTAVGLAAALATGGVLKGLLFGVEPTDGATLALVTGTLMLVALTASWIPARRASRIHPVDAITSD